LAHLDNLSHWSSRRRPGCVKALHNVPLWLNFSVTRFLASLLFEVKPLDPLTFAAVPVLLSLIAVLACYLPARQAAVIDPMTILRQE
jgi:ABC-type lipoprotein release transport system permease subunit